ncbi:MAG: RsmE family RNA methyltransferase, partial [Caldilineaceae bacterium]
MPASDKTANNRIDGPRLYVIATLTAGSPVPLERGQSNYLANVLRLGAGARVLCFNGRDGEWLCEIAPVSRKEIALQPLEQLRPQPLSGDLHYLFAPLKSARLDYMAQKAVEMGA